MRRQVSRVPGGFLSQEAVENLRSFFAILQEWDEADREGARQLVNAGHQRAARIIVDHCKVSVESN